MTLADYVVRQMQVWGIDTVFGVPGETVLSLLQSLQAAGKPRFVVCRHAESAALMASAYGKASGKPAACIADAGPGAVQMLNGVYDARMDRVPLLVITGEPRSDRGGFGPGEPTDSVYRAVAVYNETLSGANQAPRLLGNALRRMAGHNRPVRIGVPYHLWDDTVSDARFVEPPGDEDGGAEVRPKERVLAKAAERLARANRPVLFAGLGVAGAVPELLRLARLLQAPIVHSLPAAGIIPPDDEWNLGVIGKFGTQAAADAFGRADVVLTVGTTWWEPEFAADDVQVIQVDIAREHLGMTFPADIGVWGDAALVLHRLAEGVGPREPGEHPKSHGADGAKAEDGDESSWADGVAERRGDADSPRGEWARFVGRLRFALESEWHEMSHKTEAPLEPGAVIAEVGKSLVPDAVVSVDVGNNTFWFSRYMRGPDMQVLLSGHWRTAGFGLPGAVAAKLAHPHRQVVAVSGDGGFAMSMAELLTAVKYRLPILCVILSDGRYGEEAVRQEAQGHATEATGLYEPDWAAFARACGAAGYTVRDFNDLRRALDDALPALARGQTSVLHVHIARVAPLHPRPVRVTQQWLEPTGVSRSPDLWTIEPEERGASVGNRERDGEFEQKPERDRVGVPVVGGNAFRP